MTPDPEVLTVPALLELLERVRADRHVLFVAEADAPRFAELIEQHDLAALVELKVSPHVVAGNAFVIRPPRQFPMPSVLIELDLEATGP